MDVVWLVAGVAFCLGSSGLVRFFNSLRTEA